jgi:uncharacterized protein
MRQATINPIKTSIMKRLLIALFVTLSLGAFAQEQEIKQHFIEVVGNSKMEVSPDIAYFSLLLVDNPKESINVEKQEVEIAKVLKKYGVPSENLTIDKLSGIRQKVSFWGTKDVVNRKSYLLKLTNLAVSDKIIEELSALKINAISLYKVENSQIETHKLTACELASKNAKEKAASFCKGMGVAVLAPLAIYEQNLFVSGEENEYQPRLYMAKAMEDNAVGGEQEEPQQAFKNIVIKCTVRAKIEVK